MEKKALLITFSILAIIALVAGAYYFGKESHANPKNKLTLSGELANRAASDNEEFVVEKEKSPEELRSELAEKERQSPQEYLQTEDFSYSVALSNKKLIIQGKARNTASVATFKDVVVRFEYFSKTNSHLGTTEKTIYEYFPPNKVYSFTWTITNPEGVMNSAIKRVRSSVADAGSVPNVEF